ncbi:MAG: hypothetical protein IKP42_08515 [Ruminococcus sp.]|nr:hypothetical protein [Ruminococcus sp.]
MNRKKYNPALVMFPIGLLELLLITGVPVGRSALPIAALAVFGIASAAIIVLSATVKGNIRLFVSVGAIILASLIFIGIVEVAYKNEVILLAVGWLMGMCIGIGGIIKTLRNREGYKIIMSLVFNGITILLSVIAAVGELISFRGLVILENAEPLIKGQ